MEGTINGYCFTNLDKFKGENWPTEFSCKPQVGDRVESKSGNTTLYVVSVTHRMGIHFPELRVELHKDNPRCFK